MHSFTVGYDEMLCRFLYGRFACGRRMHPVYIGPAYRCIDAWSCHHTGAFMSWSHPDCWPDDCHWGYEQTLHPSVCYLWEIQDTVGCANRVFGSDPSMAMNHGFFSVIVPQPALGWDRNTLGKSWTWNQGQVQSQRSVCRLPLNYHRLGADWSLTFHLLQCDGCDCGNLKKKWGWGQVCKYVQRILVNRPWNVVSWRSARNAVPVRIYMTSKYNLLQFIHQDRNKMN